MIVYAVVYVFGILFPLVYGSVCLCMVVCVVVRLCVWFGMCVLYGCLWLWSFADDCDHMLVCMIVYVFVVGFVYLCCMRFVFFVCVCLCCWMLVCMIVCFLCFAWCVWLCTLLCRNVYALFVWLPAIEIICLWILTYDVVYDCVGVCMFVRLSVLCPILYLCCQIWYILECLCVWLCMIVHEFRMIV